MHYTNNRWKGATQRRNGGKIKRGNRAKSSPLSYDMVMVSSRGNGFDELLVQALGLQDTYVGSSAQVLTCSQIIYE